MGRFTKRVARAVLLAFSLLLAVIALPAGAEGGGAQRTVLVEFFCTQGCQWAATAADALDRVADEYGPEQVLVLEYNLDLDRELFERRFHLYVPPGTHVPFAFFDGSRLGIYGSNNDAEESYGWYRDAVEQELAAPSPLRLAVARHVEGRQVAFEARLTNVSERPLDSADLYFALYERAQVGRTHRLLRHLSPALSVGPLAPRGSRTIAYTCPALAAEADLARIEGLAFVQERDSLEVHQAAHAGLPSLTLGLDSLAAVVTPGSPALGPHAVMVDGLGLSFSWTVAAPSEQWLEVAPRAGARGEAFQVTVDPAGLPYGTYTAAVVVRADAALTPAERTLSVTVHVAPEVRTTYVPLVATG
ncbi:MAG: hypothetical protein HPY83_09670 [Anaerolineae bacterium]|nr:hypothetical protein [Anaerolineae bacterium]